LFPDPPVQLFIHLVFPPPVLLHIFRPWVVVVVVVVTSMLLVFFLRFELMTPPFSTLF